MNNRTVTREEVLALREQHFSYRQIEKRLRIGRMTAWRLVNDERKGGKPIGERMRMNNFPKVIGDGPSYPDIDENDKDALIARLRLENDILREVNEFLKVERLGQMKNREKSRLIESLRQKTFHPLKELTAFLKISKSSYEYWRIHLYDTSTRDMLADEVERIFEEEGHCARGYRFVHAKLVEKRGRAVSEKIVRDIMRKRGLTVTYKKRTRRYSSYAGEIDAAAKNIPLRDDGTHDFFADTPNEKWVSDITEFRLPDASKVYLSPVIDLFDGKPLAWSIGLHPDAELANSSLAKACRKLKKDDHPFCHTDRGCHYRWPGWKRICEENGITRSMSRKGCSPDNAVCEGFFGRLKNEFFYGRDWCGITVDDFMDRLDSWMRFYSQERLKAFRENGKWVYDTIDNRRRRLGLTA